MQDPGLAIANVADPKEDGRQIRRMHARVLVRLLTNGAGTFGVIASMGIIATVCTLGLAYSMPARGQPYLVTSIGRRRLCSHWFAQEVLEAAWQIGLCAVPTGGFLSDAEELSRWLAEVVNLSVGYYLPHTASEFVSIRDLLSAYAWVKECFHRMP